MAKEDLNVNDDFEGGMLSAEEAAKIQPVETPEEVVEDTPPAEEEPIEEQAQEETPPEVEETPGNLFDDFEDEVEEVEVPSLVKELGFESTEELKKALRPSEEKESKATSFASDEIASYVSKIDKIARSGGDWRKIVDVSGEVSGLNTKIASHEKNLEFLNSIKSNSDVAAHKKFLKLKYESFDGLGQANVSAMIDGLDEMSDNQVIRESVSAANEWARSLNGELTGFKSKVSELNAQQEEMVTAAQQSAAAARQALEQAFDGFEDSDSKVFTKRVRSVAKSVVNSQPTTTILPEAVNKILFYDENGNFSAEKMVQTLATVMNAGKKLEHAKKKAELKAFGNLKDADPRPASTKVEKDVEVDDFSGTITNSREATRGLVFND